MKYGIFGLSSSNLPEGVEKRYFVSRIKEIGRKSLDINVVCVINRRSVATYRKVFSSGTAEINGIISDDTGMFSKSPRTIEREKEYYESLKGELGKVNTEELDFISELLFADENRKPILWTKDLQNFASRLLSSSEKANSLKALESRLFEAERELNKVRQVLNQKENKYADNKRYLGFLETSLNDLDMVRLEEYEEEFKNTKADLENCRKTMAKISETYESELNNRRNLLLQIRSNEKKGEELAEKLENLKRDYLGAFFKSASSDAYPVGNYVYYKKQCPICSTDIAREVSTRLENKKCPLCGKSDLINHGSMEEIEKLMFELKTEKENADSIQSYVQQGISSSQQEIDKLNMVLSEQHALEANLLVKINNFRSTEEDLHNRDLLIKQSDQLSTALKNEEQEIQKIKQRIEAETFEIAQIKEMQSNARIEIYSETTKVLSIVRQTFLSFVDMATNGEVKASLSSELIPELNGRPVFTSDALSQFERMLLDYAFRVAFLSVFADKTGLKPSLVLETPDEGADESYIRYLANAFFTFSSNLSIIITTYNTELMRQILSHYEKNERGRHFTDLVSKGTLTQRKYYEASITDYSESN